MRHSLFLRLLGLSLAVAVFAIGATAWLTTRETSERFRGEFERTLEADTFLYQQLTSYAMAHDSWADVTETVAELAEQSGRRVALTSLDGEIIADSAASSSDDAPSLPSDPTAEIDAATAEGSAMGGTYTALDATIIEAVDSVGAAGIDVLDVPLDAASVGVQVANSMSGQYMSPTWRMSDDELERRNRLAAEAETCVQRDIGTEDDVVVSISGDVFTMYEARDSLRLEGELEPVERLETGTTSVEGDAVDRCIPDELREPSRIAQELNESYVRLATECLDEHGASYSTITNDYGLKVVVPEFTEGQGVEVSDGGEGERPETSATGEATGADIASTECLSTAWEDAMAAFVAEPALLYTGGEERFDPFVGDGLGRTLVAGGSVLAVVTGVTVFGGRRLTRPIRALTDATRRMGDGEHGVRVRTSGRDEVAQLSGAFNSMAASIEANQTQRRAMISDVAHELRTPLSNVQGYLEAAEDGVVPLDPELVRSLLEESSLLRRLIDDLQELALADAGMLRFHQEPRDATEVARQVVAAHRAGADEAGVTLSVESELEGSEGDASQAIVWVDPERLRQALSNLVSNAVRFTPDGGEVRVCARRGDGSAVLTVEDDGAGIPAEHLPRLFDRFYRVESSRSRETGGSGLGLAITKHLVEAQGGSIDVESTPGAGSVFTIRLPLHSPVDAV
ncbi:sensor histidine kinase [Phytoactinopolyspora endophytica]|uniref:sensor histidine kinase n=1 Tax=Phytoactinopolyspora endophytica TaxID=1642495 RepID=UPI00101DDE1B|nr:ATP-binding protein [Phytoactinopolyspora endophytica]